MNSLPYIIVVFISTIRLGRSDADWDYLLFSQRWPITACMEWKEAKEHNFCALPKYNTHWVIHGAWPTKSGTQGPNFCSKVTFDEKALLPIQDKLDEEWTNIEMPSTTTSFWKHEWLKHGSCAASLPALDTEFKYFSEGLKLAEKFDIANMLAKNSVVLGDKPYSSHQIYSSVYMYMNKEPAIHCIHEKGTGKILLSEIRICLNKTFDPIDCEGRNSGPVVNCGSDPSEEVVYYPATVPKAGTRSSYTYTSGPSTGTHWLYKLLYILRILLWFWF